MTISVIARSDPILQQRKVDLSAVNESSAVSYDALQNDETPPGATVHVHRIRGHNVPPSDYVRKPPTPRVSAVPCAALLT